MCFLRATIEASRKIVSIEATKFFIVNAFRKAYLKCLIKHDLNFKLSIDVSFICRPVHRYIHVYIEIHFCYFKEP